MGNKRMIKVVFGAGLAALFLAGCGDEVTQVTGLQTVANLQEAGKCSVGDMVFNLEDSQVYICGADNKWGVLKGEKGADGSSCTASPVANGVEIYCGDQLVTTILSGQDGAPGQNCTGRVIDGVGIEITCGGVVLDTLRNANGQGDGVSSVSSSSSGSSSSSSISFSSSSSSAAANLVVDAGADAICYNNAACVFSGTASVTNIEKYLWDYEGDGVFDDSSATNSFSHTYADTSATAAYTAKFCARDDGGNEVCDTTHVSVTNRAPKLTGIVLGKLVATNTYGLFVDSLRFVDADDNLQPIFYWDLDDDGIFETVRQSADTVVLATNDGALRHIAVYCKDIWGLSSDTVHAMYGRGPQLLDTRDGKTYATVGIGTQLWMAENLNYEYKVNGSTYGNWCYEDGAQYCAQYGRLYSWASAMDSLTTGCGDGRTCPASLSRAQGVCPDGWHLPGVAEWRVLLAAVGGAETAGTMLKSTTGWSNNGNGEDIVGFSALPSGHRDTAGSFSSAGRYAYFWSSSKYSLPNAPLMYLSFNDAHVNVGGGWPKNYGLSVRCVKD